MDRIKVAPGLMFPYFPPRPLHGVALTKSNVYDFIDKMAKTHVVQPKLGGDRAIVLVKDGVVQVSSRHYAAYRHTVNKARWLKMPDNTLLDGEVWKKEFYPFEAIVVGGESLAGKGPEVRMDKAKELSAEVGQKFLFDTPVRGGSWFVNSKDPNEWEGIVCKARGSRYIPLASAGQESGNWIKNKWP